jgi:hypothetical protein
MFRSAMDSAGLQFSIECHPIGEPVFVDPGMWENRESFRYRRCYRPAQRACPLFANCGRRRSAILQDLGPVRNAATWLAGALRLKARRPPDPTKLAYGHRRPIVLVRNRLHEARA